MTEVRFRGCAIEERGVPLEEGEGPDIAKRGQAGEGEVQVLWIDPWQEAALLQRQCARVRSGTVDTLGDALEPILEVGRFQMDGFKKVGLTPASPRL